MNRMKVYNEFLQKVTKKDLNTEMMLCEVDYLPPAFRQLVKEHIDEIEKVLLEDILYELENEIIHNVLVNNADKKESVSMYKREIKKYPRLYINAAMRSLTKLLIDLPDLLVGYCSETKDLYYYDWKEGFVRRVVLVYHKSIFDDDFPECSRKAVLTEMNEVYGFDDISRYDQNVSLKLEDIKKLS